jgi:hypothetical protein
MKRTTVTLSEGEARLLELEAKKQGTSASDVVRRLIREHLAGNGGGGIEELIGIGDSGGGDTSERVDEILKAEWANAINRHRDS